jgi:nucleotide-binding universal stress UspA family protein
MEALCVKGWSHMYQHILVATGGSPWSDAAVAYAIAIAARTGAVLRILTVLTHPGVYANPDVMGGVELVTDVIEQDAQALLTRAAEQAYDAGVTCETLWRWGNVPQTILQIASEFPCDLVVLGARRLSGWKRLRLGHIANAVTAKAQQPVLVVKHPPSAAPNAPLGQRLLVATEGSPWSDAALGHALTLAQTQRFSICLLHVLPGRRPSSTSEAEGYRILDRAQKRATVAGVSTTITLASGDATAAIVNMATKESCDGIILGSRGSSGWKRLMVGSISSAVAVKSPLPVLIVKRF